MGLTFADGKLFVADPPRIIALEDLDGDGRAEHRKTVLEGFGHEDNGSLHGLTFGPDGWLYMTMGAPDGYELRRNDGSVLQAIRALLEEVTPAALRAVVAVLGDKSALRAKGSFRLPV